MTILRTILNRVALAGAAGALASSGLGGPSEATPPPHVTAPISTVVELFTSQGCSSCPPADELLAKLAGRDDVLAISLPVDYWDYIGWKDTLASPRNTARQRAYAVSLGFNQVFTPQAVVNGQAYAVGSNETEVEKAMAVGKAGLAERRVPVIFEATGDMLRIATGAVPAGVEFRHATIWLVVMQRSAEVEIKRGENAGRSMTYTNVVHEMIPIGVWDPDSPANVTIAASSYLFEADRDDIAAIVQEGDAGPIIGASWLKR